MSNTNSTGLSPGDMEELILRSNLDFMTTMAATLAYLVLLMTLGLVGNVLVLIVYYKKFKPSTTRTYILAMGVVDLLSSAVALPSDIAETRFHYDFQSEGVCRFFGYITRFLALYGAVILVAVALDRHRKVCGHGLRRRRSVKYVCVELAFLCVFALILASPFGVLRGLQAIAIPGSDVKGHECAIADTHVGSLFFVLYNAATFLAFFICVFIMSVSYGLIARHLWQHRRNTLSHVIDRKTSETPHGRERQHEDFSLDTSCDVRVFSAGDDSQHTVNSLGDTRTTALDSSLCGSPSQADNVCSEDRGTENDCHQTIESLEHSRTPALGSHLCVSQSLADKRNVSEDGCSEDRDAVDSATLRQISLPPGETDATATLQKEINNLRVSQSQDYLQNVHEDGCSEDIGTTDDDTRTHISRPAETQAETTPRKHINTANPSSTETVSDIATACESHRRVFKQTERQSVSSLNTTQGSNNETGPQETHASRLQDTTDESVSSLGLPQEQDSSANTISVTEPRVNRLRTSHCENLAVLSEVKDFATETCNRKITQTKKQPVRAKPNTKKGVQQVQGRTTLIMFVLTAAFVVSYLPYIVTAAVFRGKDSLDADDWVLNVQQVALRSFFINNAVNPFVYGFCSATFRQEVKAMFR